MRFYKLVSILLHPIVIPTIATILYFSVVPIHIPIKQQYLLLSIIFITTYITPLILLVFLKAIGYIKSFHIHTIKERKIPLFFMIGLFFILGKVFYKIPFIRDFSYLFFGSCIGLIIVYLLFFIKIKASLHLLSMGSMIGGLLLIQRIYTITIVPTISILILFSGIVASSRLYLKAHTEKEVYLGFFLGVISQFITYFIL